MTTEALMTLAQWLSPSYPVGAFTYSHGLEWEVETGRIRSAATLQDWLADILAKGSGHNDALFLAAAYRAGTPTDLAEIDAHCRAFAPSKERLLETEAQGAAFATTTAAVWGHALPPMAYPVAVGAAARLQDLPLEDTAALYLHAFASNIVSAGIRLIPLGQTEGQAALAQLSPLCRDIAAKSLTGTLDDLGGATMLADIASMKHETQRTRLFRT